MSETETRNPDQNPSPTESEESEEDCVVCEMYPVDDEPTKTSNRALSVNLMRSAAPEAQ